MTSADVVDWLPIAGVVNLALAIVLFAKSIIVARGTAPPHTHKFTELLALFTDDERRTTEQHFAAHHPAGRLDVAAAFADDLFTRVRYWYERADGVVHFYDRSLRPLADSLRVVAERAVHDQPV